MSNIVPAINFLAINQQFNGTMAALVATKNTKRKQAQYEQEEDILSDVEFNAWSKYKNVMFLFPKVYNAWKIGQLDNERVIRFFRSALVDIEDCLAENPDSENLQEQKTDIEKYLARIDKIVKPQDEVEKSESMQDQKIKNVPLPNEYKNPMLDKIYNVYPLFKIHLPYLVTNDFFRTLPDDKIYEKFICENKSFLYDYIKDIHKKRYGAKKVNTFWSGFENLFDLEKGCIKGTKGSRADVKSPEFKRWNVIENNIPTCM